MLTIEELVIQSLYHKLVLVNVKRKPIQTPTGGKMDGLGLLIVGGQRMRAAMASQGSLPAPSTSTDDLDDEAAAAMPTPVTLSQGHGEIRVNPDLQTILDTGEFKLVRHMVQQQQEPDHLSPLWFLGADERSADAAVNGDVSEEVKVTVRSTSDCPSQRAVVTSQPGIVAHMQGGDIVSSSTADMRSMDLSAYEQFSVLHYMDLRDPVHRSMVMVQTPQLMGAGRMPTLPETEERLGLEPCSSPFSMCAMDLCPSLEQHNTLTILPRPQPSEDGASHNGGMEMSFDNEIDSGIWDMMLGREGQMSVHELSTTLPDLPNGHPKSLASIFPSNDNDENEQEEKAYIPDTEPVMSYKVFQISDEVVCSSSGDELEKDSTPHIKHKVETITEKKALPLGSAGKRKVKRKVKVRARGGSRRGRVLRRTKTPPRTPTNLPVGGRGFGTSDISSPEGYTTSGTTTSAPYHTAAENLDSDVLWSPDALKEGVILHGGIRVKLEQQKDREIDPDRTPTADRPYRTFSPGPRSPLETTFDLDNSVTSSHDDLPHGRLYNTPLVGPARSSRLGLNLLRSSRKSSGQHGSIVNRHSLQDGHLSSPMSEDTLTPSSEDSMFENFVDASTVPTLDYRRSRPRSFSPGLSSRPKMASFRGPFLSVPNVQRGTPSDDSDQEYETADELMLQESCVAVDLADLPGFVDHSNWMSELPKRLHAAPLSVLAIPGSNISLAIEHDMRTDLNFSKCNLEMAEFLRKLPPLAVFDNFRGLMKTIWRSWMAKQMLSVKQQLLAGVRYFDFRITKYRCALYGEHGLFTRQLKRYLKDIDEFLIEHPKEVVILHFQRFENLDHRDKRALVTALFQIYGARLCKTMKVEKTSLEMMWEHRRQVIVILPDSDIEELHDHIFVGLMWSDKCFKLSLPRKQRAMDLIRYLDCVYDDRRSLDSFQVTQAVLSPDLRMVFGDYHYRSMKELCLAETCPHLKQWMLGKNDLNILAIDYVGAYDLTGSIIALNELKKAETVV